MNRTIALVAVVCMSTFFGCGGDDSSTSPSHSGTIAVDAGRDQAAMACQYVALAGSVTGAAHSVHWEFVGPTQTYLDQYGTPAVSFVAPAVVVPTTLTLRLVAIDDEGVAYADEAQILVEPGSPEAGLAGGMAADCAPFRHGIASGDPLADAVVLWTRITPEPPAEDSPDLPPEVRWQVAKDISFKDLVAMGTVIAEPARDYTVKVDVTGLEPSTSYYYRFFDVFGRSSAIGRTRTAPVGQVDHLRFAVASCSSIYSGYFNAYRRIAERDDLDLMIHLGDYLYDFVDGDEQIRIPDPHPEEPTTLEQWRARHAYYLSDPDLRAARAAHPWAMIWDNHDLEANAPNYNGGAQAFREWNPIRESAESDILYRTFHYGSLVDLIFLDALLHRNVDLVPGTNAKSILGNPQFDWLAGQLRESHAAWRVIANQRLFGTVRINSLYAQAIDGERREVFDTGAWDGFPEDRSRILNLLIDEGIRDNIVLSGDSHVSVAMDLVDHPLDPNAPSAGVEFLPTSISRGNFDEALFGLGFNFEQAHDLIAKILADTALRNPHHRYLELTMHGYGVLDIDSSRATAEFRYSSILARSEEDFLGQILVDPRGTDRWQRPAGAD